MIVYEEESVLELLLLPFRLKGSVSIKAFRFAFPSALLALFLALIDEIFALIDPSILVALRDYIGLADQGQVSVLWAASTAVLVVLLGFRTNRAMARFWEGTGLLHQMRGEWFDSVSCCVTFSRSSQKEKPEKVEDFRHTIVRLMSLCHGCALEEISLSPAENLETIDTMGLDDETLQHLKLCKEEYDFNRVEVLLHLIQSLITINHDEGVLKVPPPILSRVYQTLSRGFVNLLNAKKIADTRFPFPYAQTIAMLCFVNTVLTPVLMSCLVDSPLWAAIFTFVPVFGFFSLNFIGMELENPFGDDDNDLPLFHFQSEMNNCLMMLLQEKADLVPGISSTRCLKNFQVLKRTVGPEQESEFEIEEDPTFEEDGSPRPGLHRLVTPSRVSICDHFNLENDGEDAHHSLESPPKSARPSSEEGDPPAQTDVSQLANLLPVAEKAVPGAFDVTMEAGAGDPAAFRRSMSANQDSGSTLGTQGDSVSERLERSLRELQRLLDDELLLDLGRSAGSLKLFCDAIATTIEALPRAARPNDRTKPGTEASGSTYFCHGGPRLSSHRPDGLDMPQSLSPRPRNEDGCIERTLSREPGKPPTSDIDFVTMAV